MMSLKSISFLLLLITFSNIVSKHVHFLKNQFSSFQPIITQISLLQSKAVLTTTSVGAFCFLNSNGIIYDLNPLYRKSDDYNQTYANNDVLSVNVCSRTYKNCTNKNALAIYTNGQSKECIALSGDQNAFLNYTINCKITI